VTCPLHCIHEITHSWAGAIAWFFTPLSKLLLLNDSKEIHTMQEDSSIHGKTQLHALQKQLYTQQQTAACTAKTDLWTAKTVPYTTKTAPCTANNSAMRCKKKQLHALQIAAPITLPGFKQLLSKLKDFLSLHT